MRITRYPPANSINETEDMFIIDSPKEGTRSVNLSMIKDYILGGGNSDEETRPYKLYSVVVYVANSNELKFRSNMIKTGNGGSRQSVWLFGMCNNSVHIAGMLNLWNNGQIIYKPMNGTANLTSITIEDDTVVTIMLPGIAWDRFLLLSPEFIHEI